jgi:hypothetical protein
MPMEPTATKLTKGPSQLLPSDSSLVLQYGSGHSSEFLAKILGVGTALFSWKTQLNFPLLHSLVRCYISCTTSDSSVGSMSVYGTAGLCYIPL